jgi:hypothetical protein
LQFINSTSYINLINVFGFQLKVLVA